MERIQIFGLIGRLYRYKIEPSKEDIWRWSPARNDLFATKTTYELLSADADEDSTKKATLNRFGPTLHLKEFKSLCGRF